MRQPRSQEEELRGFTDRVFSLIRSGKPVKIQVGFAYTPWPGFVNLDIQSWMPESDNRFAGIDLDIFYFPYADIPWPIPDNCVDYIFHEDFIEHISQKQQICFLAETLRVLKGGCWHRVNTPCLAGSMKRHSHFAAGMKGVHTDEWDRLSHVNLLTRNSLEEMAKLVGYREVLFNQRNQSLSPHRPPVETRPGEDRDEIFGNIFADLLK